ncbi:hypothetical protein NLU13_6225 [Sarocladium strictum]|uniref:Xylanolytic transcriptional activator regulatory domain-containing protein n=1 Tax=Sarocladium strictum TaxID=5046 RepID=A0AA39L6X2_SARSR|nr:hypothetical protein NLU13_6225 [Sarocladium strictum]
MAQRHSLYSTFDHNLVLEFSASKPPLNLQSTRRRRCIFPEVRNATTCEYCLARHLPCVKAAPKGGYYAQREARLHAEQSAPGTDAHDVYSEASAASALTDTRLPHMALQLELIDLYFQYIHDQFHSLFHRPTFTDDVANERIPAVVLFAVFALSSRFSNHHLLTGTAPWQRGEQFRIASENLLNIRHVSIVTIQTCILLGAYAAADGDIDVENLYYNTAGRLSLLLDLPNQPASGILERELNTRTWWTLCMVDVWSSTAVKLPRIMPFASAMPLPMDEIPFLSIRPHSTLSVDPSPSTPASPLMAEMIKLNRVLSGVIDFNRRCVAESLEGPALEAGVRELSTKLDDWSAQLPLNMLDTQESLQWFVSQGLGRMFAAVYLGYYHYGQLLYYQFLGADSSMPPAIVARYAERCKAHADRLCDLVYRTFAIPDCKVLYATVAHIIVIASTVQIHTLLFSSNDTEINESKSRLERNFRVLLELRQYWTSVESAMNRLHAFHETCLRSKDNSFVLDRWLLRFLVEFAAHMEFKPRVEDPSYQALLSLPDPTEEMTWTPHQQVD